MNQKRQHRLTHLFTVRRWIEPGARSSAEVRGQVQHILSNEVIYLRTWTALVTFFETALIIAHPLPAPGDGNRGASADG